jgi:hypothetical protein
MTTNASLNSAVNQYEFSKSPYFVLKSKANTKRDLYKDARVINGSLAPQDIINALSIN